MSFRIRSVNEHYAIRTQNLKDRHNVNRYVLADASAGRVTVKIVPHDDLSGDGESQPVSARRPRGIDPVEPLEDVRQV